jgi:hypothetical protein
VYLAKVDSIIDNGPGAWNSTLIGIYEWNPETNEERRLGEYRRNYPRLARTFHPFTVNGRDYALYSTDYTATRIMSLPDCKDLGGEDRDSWGFCPCDYHVYVTETGYLFGFVSGCVWGDDHYMKVQYLDLRRADQGIIRREERFGRLEIPNDLTLEESIQITDYTCGELDDPEVFIEIKTVASFCWYQDGLSHVAKVQEERPEEDDVVEPW